MLLSLLLIFLNNTSLFFLSFFHGVRSFFPFEPSPPRSTLHFLLHLHDCSLHRERQMTLRLLPSPQFFLVGFRNSKDSLFFLASSFFFLSFFATGLNFRCSPFANHVHLPSRAGRLFSTTELILSGEGLYIQCVFFSGAFLRAAHLHKFFFFFPRRAVMFAWAFLSEFFVHVDVIWPIHSFFLRPLLPDSFNAPAPRCFHRSKLFLTARFLNLVFPR